jgi:hypothetical protein
MLDNPASQPEAGISSRPRLDLQQHLADLEAAGLLVHIDRPINKDTELSPLVRWQFIGGVPEGQRRAFLFTNVIDSKGKRYEMPVVVGALASSPEIYAMGMGLPVDQIGDAWMHAIGNPIPPVAVTDAPCQEVVIEGDALRAPDGGLKVLPVPVSTPGFDAAPYLTATLCVTKDPDSGVRNMGTYRAALKASDRLVVRMVAREATGAGGYLHWLKYRERGAKMPIAIVVGCAPIVMFTGPQKLAVDMDEMAVAGGAAGEPIRMTRCRTIDLAQEKERLLLGNELHDNVNQILTTARLYLDMINLEDSADKEIKDKTKEFIVLAYDEIRKLSRELVSPQLKASSITIGIQELVDDIEVSGQFNIVFNHDPIITVSKSLKITLYRIVQEQLKNIIRYSKATDVAIELRSPSNQVSLLESPCPL